MSLLDVVEARIGRDERDEAAAPDEGVSRRGLFRAMMGGESRTTAKGAGALAAMWAVAAASGRPPSMNVVGEADSNSMMQALVRRVTMGITQAELDRANSMGFGAYLEYQLNAQAIDDSVIETRLAALTTLAMTPLQAIALSDGQLRNELSEAMLLRSIYSERQLLQRMVEFWTDHFNIDINKTPCTRLKTVDDRAVIRPFALSTFPALLNASAHSTAMLTYLDNQSSTATTPNENYAREIMELHTLGVDGGYTQQDVIEVARCFSGWGYVPIRAANANSGDFLFTASRHTNGPKTVLGNVITAGGINDGMAVLDILANHPSTARFIAKKLCRWFLGEATPQGTVDAVTATYTATGGDIKAMLRAILTPTNLIGAAPRYKRPYHHFVSAMRSLPTTITATSTLRSLLNSAGHHPFFWATPDGYPDNLDYWVGYIIPRWNFGATLMNNLNGVSVNTTAFAAGETNANALADKINQAMFGGEMAPAEYNRIRDYMLPNPVTNGRLREAIGLAIGSPGFQWY